MNNKRKMKKKKKRTSPIILAFRRLRQKDHEFEASVDYIVRLSIKKQTTPKKNMPTLG
jgi:hypothetical protein